MQTNRHMNEAKLTYKRMQVGYGTLDAQRSLWAQKITQWVDFILLFQHIVVTGTVHAWREWHNAAWVLDSLTLKSGFA